MKILQIGATFVGAQKKIEYSLHKYLTRYGYDSYILYAVGKSDESKIICYENKFDSFIRRVFRKILGKNSFFALISTIKLIVKTKKINPDIVHIHIIHHGYLYFKLLLFYLAKLNVPILFTVHDAWFYTGGCYYYSKIGCNNFIYGCKSCPKQKSELDCNLKSVANNFKSKVNLFNKFNCIGFVSVSPWLNQEINKSFLASYSNYIIMNAVDYTECISSVDNRNKNERFTVIGVATSWDQRKGIDLFIDLGKKVSSFCDIILVGSISETIKSRAPSNITFYGCIHSDSELYDLYSTSDIHVSLSFEETFGMTFVEAALAGIKSIGFNSTAIPDIIRKTYGYIADPYDINSIVNILKILSKNREFCKISKDEHNNIKEYFSADRMGYEYLKAYNDLLILNNKKEV